MPLPGLSASAFPAVRLTGSSGYLSKDVDSVLSADSQVWSIGPLVILAFTGWAMIRFKVEARVAAQRYLATVRLIKVLGGAWWAW